MLQLAADILDELRDNCRGRRQVRVSTMGGLPGQQRHAAAGQLDNGAHWLWLRQTDLCAACPEHLNGFSGCTLVPAPRQQEQTSRSW